jgi:hypothetical protein
MLGGAAAWPLAALAQQLGPMRRVGVLMASIATERSFQSYLVGILGGAATGGMD